MAQLAKSQTLRYTLLSKNVLTADEAELYELSNLAGIVFDPNVFKIIIDLLRLNVAPTAIEGMLKNMLAQQKKRPNVDGAESASSSGSLSHVPVSKGRHPSGSRSRSGQK